MNGYLLCIPLTTGGWQTLLVYLGGGGATRGWNFLPDSEQSVYLDSLGPREDRLLPLS